MREKTKLVNLAKEIEDTRVMLYELISKKHYNLLDLEVIELSKLLDELLSQYHSIK
ncbi:aspartyl-phosphate phosphatase Spo0E family protein [Tissierella praeacuta]|uniref:aspartyl-phosphate phosphatase Spo0E family protein n=1 Tax=Tissierella praeacuta TaxID=43131 RepID=UPI000A06910F|nr:aspartyl-phosphate phosphatase Spo0E family protein [Tissierella praeacuta]